METCNHRWEREPDTERIVRCLECGALLRVRITECKGSWGGKFNIHLIKAGTSHIVKRDIHRLTHWLNTTGLADMWREPAEADVVDSEDQQR